MSNINRNIAEEAVKLLKSANLISDDEKNIENQIANGTVKENDWKIVFEQQLRNLEKLSDETK